MPGEHSIPLGLLIVSSSILKSGKKTSYRELLLWLNAYTDSSAHRSYSGNCLRGARTRPSGRGSVLVWLFPESLYASRGRNHIQTGELHLSQPMCLDTDSLTGHPNRGKIEYDASSQQLQL